MLLGPVRVGVDSSVGLCSVVAPFTQVPNGHHLGPVASTYGTTAIGKEHARVTRRCFSEPSIVAQVFVGRTGAKVGERSSLLAWPPIRDSRHL